MADIRCPKCGRKNPDLLDLCQFCQTPLKKDSVLHIGDNPTKKNTGELEGILPDWLKDVRQQSRAAADADASENAQKSTVKSNEPPDLLAGLSSQAGSENDDDVPDWLSGLNSSTKSEPVNPPPPTPAPETDFFAQFNQGTFEPSQGDKDTLPAQQEPSQKDELSDWFSQAAEGPAEVVQFDSDTPHDNAGWAGGLESSLPFQPEPFEPAPSARGSAEKQTPKEEEDLSWLHNLEATAKESGDVNAPAQDWGAGFDTPSSSQASGSGQDLSWLDRLGGIEASQEAAVQPSSSPQDMNWLDQFSNQQEIHPEESRREQPAPQEDLSWLNDLGEEPQAPKPFDAAPDEPVPSEPLASNDLSWLNDLGKTPAPSQQPFSVPPLEEPASAETPFSPDDLSWLNDLGGTSAPGQPINAAQESPTASPEDLSWLNDLGGQPEPLSTPPFTNTGMLSEKKLQEQPGKDASAETEPDWLKKAIEPPAMPAPGDVSREWFRKPMQPPTDKQAPVSRTPEPSPFSDTKASAPSSNEDVDALFSMDMPDWLSRPEPGAAESALPKAAIPSEREPSLAPVELPSWVQAMRPVEAVISETAPSVEEQPEEKEGPLAGMRGIIPGAPVGSSLRPKAISLKLQATDEQQAGAALLEQILDSETNPRALITSSVVASQRVLRWVLAALFLVVLGTVVGLRTQTMPVSADLPIEAANVTNTVMSIPANSKILVVVDYDPSLAGEMEATSGPLLNQVVLLGHPNLAFLATSPNGPALVERLLTNTGISKPAPDGFGYQAGTQYCNQGYLPGGAAGVLGFIEAPDQMIPSACGNANVGSFTEYQALIVITDHAESGRVWVEQLHAQRQLHPELANQHLLVIASAQAAPLLQPYVASQQISGMIGGLAAAARYEYRNNVPPGIARSYWDAFGVGMGMSLALIILGSLWNLIMGVRARRAEAEQG